MMMVFGYMNKKKPTIRDVVPPVPHTTEIFHVKVVKVQIVQEQIEQVNKYQIPSIQKIV